MEQRQSKQELPNIPQVSSPNLISTGGIAGLDERPVLPQQNIS